MSLQGRRLQWLLKYNPNWHLQPRVPAGNPDGGRWISVGANILFRLGPQAAKKLRDVGRRIAPYLRRSPKYWGRDDQFPTESEFDELTGRIADPSVRRPEHPHLRFNNERELKRYLGPAGYRREWHHIVEKRLAENGTFPPEEIHSTDNIVNLPVEVHRCVNKWMSSADPMVDNIVRRKWVERLSFRKQFNEGLGLIERCLKETGIGLD